MTFDRQIYAAFLKLGLFLYSLKLLSDKHHLDWRPGKTNHDYLDELGDGELKTGFNELSFYFDYAWYGDFKSIFTTSGTASVHNLIKPMEGKFIRLIS